MMRKFITISVTALFSTCLLTACPANADSEASWGGGSSEARWGGGSSQARWGGGSSQAQWGGWGSEASRNNSSEASSQAGSESGFGAINPGGFRRRGYWGYFNNNNGGYNPRNDPNSTYSTLKRLRQDQNQEEKHEAALSNMPNSAFVHNYGSGAGGSGLLNTIRQNYYPAATGSGGSYPANSNNYSGSYSGNYPATGGSYAHQ